MPLKDREARNAYLRKWNSENRDKTKKYMKDHLEKNPEQKMVKSSMQRAKNNGLEHTITKEDVSIPEVCPYLGIELTTEVQSNNPNFFSTASLDRIDSTKGYTPDNIQVISALANRMKSDATVEQLVVFAKSILRLHEKEA